MPSMQISSTLWKAIVLMLIASFCFTIINLCIKYVNHLPTFELVFFRAVGSAFCAIAFLKIKKIPALGNNKPLLMIRALVGIIAISLFYKAIQLMPIGTATSLRYVSPFFAAVLAILLLGEKIKPLQWLCFLTAFLGVLLLKGFDHRISIFALLVILLSAFFTGLVYVIIRKIGDQEHPVVVVNYFTTTATIVSGIVCLFYWENPSSTEWILLLSIGFLGFIAQVAMTQALQTAESNIIVPFKYTEVIFTLLFSWLLFEEYQTWISLLGIGIIIAALLTNVWIKQQK